MAGPSEHAGGRRPSEGSDGVPDTATESFSFVSESPTDNFSFVSVQSSEPLARTLQSGSRSTSSGKPYLSAQGQVSQATSVRSNATTCPRYEFHSCSVQGGLRKCLTPNNLDKQGAALAVQREAVAQQSSPVPIGASDDPRRQHLLSVINYWNMVKP